MHQSQTYLICQGKEPSVPQQPCADPRHVGPQDAAHFGGGHAANHPVARPAAGVPQRDSRPLPGRIPAAAAVQGECRHPRNNKLWSQCTRLTDVYMCMYVCMYTCLVPYMDTYIHTYVHTYIHTHAYMHVYVYIYICICIYSDTGMAPEVFLIFGSWVVTCYTPLFLICYTPLFLICYTPLFRSTTSLLI